MREQPMTSTDVIDFYSELESLGIEIWVDGGWGVDALLGEQTRPHKDLDIVIQQQDIPRFRGLVGARGYRDAKLEDAKPRNFVLCDDNGNEIDVHVIVFDDDGNGLYGQVEKGVMYPSASLTASGIIAGHIVNCISPEWVVKFHSGYELTDKDLMDVSALCKTFGIELPEEVAHHSKS